jgi:hypothetical protein
MKGMAMKRLMLLIALASSGCDTKPQGDATERTPAASEAMVPTETRQSQPPKVVPLPTDQAELDRMILAGYTPHADHLHPPGVKNCPLAKEGNEAVM